MLWCQIDFLRWRQRRGNSTSDFVFGDFAQLGGSKSTCIPNFGGISQYTVEILLLPVSWNKRSPWWNSTSSFDFYVCITIGMSFCICLPNFVQIDHPQHSYDVISILQDGGCSVAILLPVSCFMSSLIWEDRHVPAYLSLIHISEPTRPY